MELIIAFAVLSIALGAIFSSLYQESLLNKRIKTIEQEILPKVEVQQKLNAIFANIAPLDPSLKKCSLYSSGSENSLFVYFDNGIDPDLNFCGTIKGSIGLDRGNFVLHLYEEGDEKPKRTTLLRKNVKSIGFEFMLHGVNTINTVSKWEKISPTLPRFVKITLNDNESYVFWVNRECEPVLLPGKKVRSA